MWSADVEARWRELSEEVITGMAERREQHEVFAAQVAATGPLHLRRQLDAVLTQVWAQRVEAAASTRQGRGRVDCIMRQRYPLQTDLVLSQHGI